MSEWGGAERRALDERMRELARAAGKEAARDVLLPLGIDIDDGDSFRSFSADLAFLRRTREASEKFNSGTKLAIVTAALLAMTSGAGWLITFLFTPKH